MTTTTQIRSWWSPACSGPFTRFMLYGGAVISVRSQIVDAVRALSACLEAHEYQARPRDTGAYNCRPITGGTAFSLHAYGVAVDINWTSNPYGPRLVTDMPASMVAAIKGIRTRTGQQVWRWGGDYTGNRDAMHFEVCCSPTQLAAGIDPRTVPSLTIPTPEGPFMALTDAQQEQLYEDVALIRRRLATSSTLDSKEDGDRSVVERRVADIFRRLADVERAVHRIEVKIK